MPSVSVVIPSYNSSRYLAEAIDSVLAQTYQDFEIIVIDDGSTDSTAELVAGYGDRVRYYQQHQRGPAAARNLGIRSARGRYVAFQDADDLWMPDKLAKQMALLERRPELAMVFCGHTAFDVEGPVTWCRGLEKRRWLMKGDVVQNIFLNSEIGTPTVMVRRDVFDSVGGFDEDLQIGEDDNLWMRIASAYPVELLDEPMAAVRVHSKGISRHPLTTYSAQLLQLQLLPVRYPALTQRLKPVLSIKRGQVHYELGLHHFSNNELKEARAAFGKAFRANPWQWLFSYRYLLTLLPHAWVRAIRRLKSEGFQEATRSQSPWQGSE
jgi:glycosyltransferase involved in cell wall biosynthesis